MSTTIDEKIVSMQFDNKNFESNVSTTMSSVEKLKQSLNFTGATKGLESIDAAAQSVDMSGLSSGVETVRLKFSALQVFAVNALNDIYRSVTNLADKMISAITIDPIKDGFTEYETQINSVQTILANTSSKGTTLDEVNAALDELNTYADKTIYNFTEMTKNIGTFTAAGVDLDTSVSAIQGIANLAAVSGSTSTQASTAMYQLSQALATGTVRLQDWNSVVNAGMGGEVFQNALKRTATAMGTDVDALIDKYGSFRDSLTQGGWLTTEVLTKTLEQFTMAAEEGSEEWENYKKSLMDEGYTEAQAKEILEMANTATDAATKVKTFTQLIDTLKEALGSGWTQTWEYVIGDFEEAQELWSGISDYLSAVINDMSNARNEMLKGWSDLGGRTALIDSLKNAFDGLLSIATPIKEAFTDIFPGITSQQLYDITNSLKEFTANLKLSETSMDGLKRTFKGLFSIIDMLGKAISVVASAIGGLLSGSGISSILDVILSVTGAIGDFFTTLDSGFKTGDLASSINTIGKSISNGVGLIIKNLSNFGSVLSSVGTWAANTLDGIWEYVSSKIGAIFGEFSAGDIATGIGAGGIVALVSEIEKLFNTGILGLILGKSKGSAKESAESFKDMFSDILGSVGDSLQAFASGIKVTSLVAIAAAVALLSSSLTKIADLSGTDVAESLAAMGGMFAMLTKSFKSISSSLSIFGSKGLTKAGVSLMMLAEAMNILADAVVKIGSLSLWSVAKGLTGVATGIQALIKGLKSLNGVNISISTSISLLALAESCKMLGDAMTKFAGLSWGEIAKGLIGMGGALTEFVGVLTALDKVGGVKTLVGSGSLVLAVQSLDDLATGLQDFGSMSWDEIGRGLVAMAGALGEMSGVTGALGKLTGFSGLLGGESLNIAVQSLADLAAGLQEFGSMSWDEIAHGLVGMGGALTELATITGVLGKLSGFSGLLGGESLNIAVQSLGDLADGLKKFGKMSWSEIEQGLVGMGGALAEVGVVTGALGKLAGFSGLLGSGSILLAVQSLGDIADALQEFGYMLWDEIARGLVGMGGALGEVATISGILGTLTGLSGLLGSGSILLAVQSLGDIADALQQIGSMTWEQIAVGLVGMGGALTELATITGVLSTLAPLSALGSSGILVGVQGLDEIADALLKLGTMSWEEVKNGLVAMGGALAELAGASGILSVLAPLSALGSGSIILGAQGLSALADALLKWKDVSFPASLPGDLTELSTGIASFTLGGLGALTISALGDSLGDLAESIKAWSDVKVPSDLETNLTSIATGIKAFTWDGLSALTIWGLASPLGTLAESVKAWSDVKVPTTIETDMQSIANGISAFTWLFTAGFNLSSIATGLGSLADAFSKWSELTLPEGIGTILSDIADGVSGFSWLFTAGYNLNSLATPLGTLADSVKKWDGVTVPSDLGTNLSSIATGLKSFKWMFDAGYQLSTIATPLGTLADSVKKWDGVTVPSDLGDNLSAVADALSAFSDVSINYQTTSAFTSVTTSCEKLSNIDFDTVCSGLSSLGTSLGEFKTAADGISTVGVTITTNLINPITDAKETFETAGSDLLSALSDGFTSNTEIMTTAASTIIDSMTTAIGDKKTDFETAGADLLTAFLDAIEAMTSESETAINTIVDAALGAAKESKSDFKSAGHDLGDGLVQGIKDKYDAAYNAGFKLGQKAAQGEKDGQKSASPSKLTIQAGKWLGEGLIIGIEKMGDSVYKASYNMGETATNTISDSIARISEAVNTDLDTQPTITPVLDLSNVSDGANSISNMLNFGSNGTLMANVNSLNAQLNGKIQNGNEDLIDAIYDLKNSMNGGTTTINNINGVTYDDGSNINSAVSEIVRAARIERRT